MFNPDPKKPIGGNIIAHASTTRYVISFGRIMSQLTNTPLAYSSKKAKARLVYVKFTTPHVCQSQSVCSLSMVFYPYVLLYLLGVDTDDYNLEDGIGDPNPKDLEN